MRIINRIFVHCTASPQSWTIEDLKKEFRNKGWHSPGYHYVVTADGRCHQMLSDDKVSNGVRGFNSTSINVAYVGGMAGKDNRTPKQKDALLELLKNLKGKYPAAHIMGHRDIWGKSPSKWHKLCPCFDAENEYKTL